MVTSIFTNGQNPLQRFGVWFGGLGRNLLFALLLGAIFGVVGPLGTYNVMPFGQRIAFWILVKTCAWLAIEGTSYIVLKSLGRLIKSTIWLYLIIIVASLPMVWFLVSFAQFRIYATPISRPDLLLVSQIALIITICITVSVNFGFVLIAMKTSYTQKPNDRIHQDIHPPIFKRLNPELKNAKWLALIAQEHYVLVESDKGNQLILLGIGQAIKECTPMSGLRIHRSYWIALSAIKGSRKEKSKLFIILKNNRELSVSRRRKQSILQTLSKHDLGEE